MKPEDYDSLLEYGHDYLAKSSGNIFKYLDLLSGDFWNCKKLITYGRPFNFVTSERSVGKSTNIAAFILLEYMVNNKKFIYCRRDKDTIQMTAKKFFNNAVEIINTKVVPKYRKELRTIRAFQLSGSEYQIAFELDEEDKPIFETIGYTVALSLEAKSKSTPFSDVYNIIFDEFLERDETKYLGNAQTKETAEYEAIMSLYESVDRGIGRAYRNETRVFFLGNIKTKYCPLYLTLHMAEYVVSDANFIAPKGKLWIMERVRDVKATENKEQSFAYQLGTDEHRKYAFSTDTLDDDSFIGIPDKYEYVDTVMLEGKVYGVRRSINSAINALYIGKPEEGRRIIALDNNSHNGIDFQLISSWRKYPLTMRMAEFYERGLLYFDNGETKRTFLKYLQFMK